MRAYKVKADSRTMLKTKNYEQAEAYARDLFQRERDIRRVEVVSPFREVITAYSR
jgi:hypothetical protein